MPMSYDKVMAIVEEEYQKEMGCAHKARDLMHKALNPVKRIQYKQAYEMFMGHAMGIRLVISRIRKEEEP